MPKYKTSVYIETTATKHIGEVEFDTIEEYNEKAQKLWESQDYEAPSTNISNNFDLSDWAIGYLDEDYLQYCEVKNMTKLFDLGDIGDLIPLEDFINACKSGSFIDYDGFGEFATKDKTSRLRISPSQLSYKEFPEWCTHILWFNR